MYGTGHCLGCYTCDNDFLKAGGLINNIIKFLLGIRHLTDQRLNAVHLK